MKRKITRRSSDHELDAIKTSKADAEKKDKGNMSFTEKANKSTYFHHHHHP